MIAGDLTKEEAAATSAARRPQIPSRAEELWTRRSPATTSTGRTARQGGTSRRTASPAGLFQTILRRRSYFAGGSQEASRPGTSGSPCPDCLVARSRTGRGPPDRPRVRRLTFDKTVAMRPRPTPTTRRLPAAELCGPGHPLFDALVGHAIEPTGGDFAEGAVFLDPTSSSPPS